MNKLESNKQMAKTVIVLLWIVLALEIANLVSSILQYNLLQTIADGGYISEQTAIANDRRESIIAILYLTTLIIMAFTFLVWFRTAYRNLHQKVSNLAYSEGWAMGAWFVPIINLYRPYLIMHELYEDTKKLINSRELSKRVDYTTTYVGWWWSIFIASGIANGIYIRFFSRNLFTIEDFIAQATMSIVVDVISIPLTLLAIKVVSDYSKVEPLLNEIKDEEQQVAETLTEKTDNAL